LKLTEPTNSFVTCYPEAEEFTKTQLSIFWQPDEIKVEKDVQDILVNLTESERHGVITVLKLFSLYEFVVGKEYWGGVVQQWFPRPEVARMASVFSMFELAVHQPFYGKLNEALGLANDDFYTSYVHDPVLSSRIEFVESLQDKDKLTSLALFSMMEGAVLYSSFAFLKHFQSSGKNKLANVVRGINFSVRDENIHALAGAWLFKKHLAEEHDNVVTEELYNNIHQGALALLEHEYAIIDKIFEKGKIENITATQLKHFALSRFNLCLRELGFSDLDVVTYNPIASWFYTGINNFQFNDFFAGIGNQYSRSWEETGFTW